MISGGFDPLHIGHLKMLEEAKKHGQVIVALNSDEWLERKKGFVFMPWTERAEILKSIKYVDWVVTVDDEDDTVCKAISKFCPDIFANGGDRIESNTPEVTLCNKLGIELLWNIGGGKQNSSSDLVARAAKSKTEERPWGEFTVLVDEDDYKVKQLKVNPGCRTSLQSHNLRTEMWFIVSGEALIHRDIDSIVMDKYSIVEIPKGMYHRITNNSDSNMLTIIEIQTGICVEEDIIRYQDDYGRQQH